MASRSTSVTPAQLANAGKTAEAGDHRENEFCGACWDSTGCTMFVNTQTPGITWAITGPWWRGVALIAVAADNGDPRGAVLSDPCRRV